MAQRSELAAQTFLFADLSGFTALTEAHGDEHAADRHCCICGDRARSRQTVAVRTRRPRPAPVSRSAFAGFCFPPDVIVLAVRWYLRFSLSYRDVEELLAERGVEVDHTTVYRWVQRFTPLLAEAARPCRHAVGDRWQVDEAYVKVAGHRRYVYRAIDQFGQVIDVFVSARRDGEAARRFFERAIGTTAITPVEVTTDQAAAYPAVLEELLPGAWHRTNQHANNHIEADHGRLKPRLRPMRGLRQDRSARVVIAGHAFVQNVRRGHYELAVEEPMNPSIGCRVRRTRLGDLTPVRSRAQACCKLTGRNTADAAAVGHTVGCGRYSPAMQETRAAPATLDAVLERITYCNQDTGYTVARVATDRSSDLLTVVGPLLGAQPGESLRLRGRWASHPQYGRQFQVEAYDTVLPATIQGIRRYLGSGLIKGIGPRMAERIVDHFGPATLQVIEEDPGRLVEVPGLGPKRSGMITAAWEEQRAIKEVMVFLQGVGVSTSLAVRIYKTYRDEAIEVVRREPYRLAADVWGIGFKTADQLAQHLGVPHDSPQRVKAGLQFALSEASEDGHCYLPETELVAQATGLLGVAVGLAGRCLEVLVAEGGVVTEPLPAVAGSQDDLPGMGRAVWLVPFHRAETALAAGLLRLLDAPIDRLAWSQAVDWTAALEWLRQATGVTLAPEQEAAVRLALTQRVAVLTGGPGCGKSYTVRAIVALARAKHAKVLLAAPTGRAAKRLAELAGLEAATLHRLLQLRPGGDAGFDRDNPLDADLVVVDEASMLDVLLANKLVKAIPPGAHLLLVGDVDQLPSVGAGEVLRDLLAAERLPRVRLTKVFRQAQRSGVVTNAHRINAGHPPVTRGLDDFFLFAQEDSEQVADLVVDIVANRLPRRFGLDPAREVQVLCPMHRGPAGAGVLNERLQAALTPARDGLAERRFGGRVYRVGDKVMQIRNNYDKGTAGAFNGSVGVVTALSLEDQELRVLLDEDEEVAYGFDELDELTHAYAVSIHRSQGSEYPCVVIPLTTSAWLMLQRNLLYTAVTRAKRLVVLVGSNRALAKAVRTQGAGRRYTALTERLPPQRAGPSHRAIGRSSRPAATGSGRG